MSPTVWLIAKLCRVDADLAHRAFECARSQDDPNASVPRSFLSGPGARAYGLSLVVSRNPVRFYMGLGGLAAFPAYLLIRYGAYLYGG